MWFKYGFHNNHIVFKTLDEKDVIWLNSWNYRFKNNLKCEILWFALWIFKPFPELIHDNCTCQVVWQMCTKMARINHFIFMCFIRCTLHICWCWTLQLHVSELDYQCFSLWVVDVIVSLAQNLCSASSYRNIMNISSNVGNWAITLKFLKNNFIIWWKCVNKSCHLIIKSK
jgi:hypothetical protein